MPTETSAPAAPNVPDTNVDLASLPAQLRRLIRAIGLADTERLLAARGGRRIWLTYRPTEAAWLASFLGEAKMAALIAAFPDHLSIDLPTSKKIEASRRNMRIRRAYACGESLSTLAERHHVTMRWIRRICAD